MRPFVTFHNVFLSYGRELLAPPPNPQAGGAPLREIGFGDVDWIHWAQDRDRWQALVNTLMNLRVP
jgi:hypothetical protein